MSQQRPLGSYCLGFSRKHGTAYILPAALQFFDVLFLTDTEQRYALDIGGGEVMTRGQICLPSDTPYDAHARGRSRKAVLYELNLFFTSRTYSEDRKPDKTSKRTTDGDENRIPYPAITWGNTFRAAECRNSDRSVRTV